MKFDFIVPEKENYQDKIKTRDGRRVIIEWVGPESIFGYIEGQKEAESWSIEGSSWHDGSLKPKDLVKI